jgi:hypothetical protein
MRQWLVGTGRLIVNSAPVPGPLLAAVRVPPWAVAIGAGWLYSLVVTLTGGGDTFYEAATVLAAFVLLGHWFEMRARGGANDAIRTLLDLAPPKATVIRDGETVEVTTAEWWRETCCWCGPATRSPWTAWWQRARARSTSRW